MTEKDSWTRGLAPLPGWLVPTIAVLAGILFGALVESCSVLLPG